jgi:uncharacterized protein YjbI with pentapeptide repeats
MLNPDQTWGRLASGGSLAGLGLARVDGRWDMRSLGTPTQPWKKGDVMPSATLRRVALRDLDLSGATLEHFTFFDCLIENCVFDGATLFDFGMFGTRVVNCSLKETTYDGGMGGDRRHPNEWIRVDFSRGDLRKSFHSSELYEDCDFSNSRLDRVDFDGSRHRRSRFVGPFEELAFHASSTMWRSRQKNTMDGVDFAGATIRDSAFHDLDLSSCVLPRSSDHLVFDRRRVFAARVLDALQASARDNVDLRVTMEAHLRHAPRGDGGPGFQHVRDLGGHEQEINEAVALLLSLGARRGSGQ